MKNNNHQLVPQKNIHVETTLPPVPDAGTFTVGSTTVAEVVRIATHQIQDVLAEVNSTIQKCEAEVEINEKINVIFETERTVFSVERSFRFAKDKE